MFDNPIRHIGSVPGTPADPRDWGQIPGEKRTPREKTIRVMGLDLGQANDRSAATVLERRVQDHDFIGPVFPFISLIKLRRYRQDTDYMDQVEDVLRFPNLDYIAVEYNGVGRPVVDALRKRALEVGFKGRIFPIVTAASNTRLHETSDAKGRVVSVPKINLVSAGNLLAQSGKLLVPDPQTCPDRETADNLHTLTREMRDFQMRVTKAANVTFGNIEKAGGHDDVVMSYFLACWFMTNKARREPAVWMP